MKGPLFIFITGMKRSAMGKAREAFQRNIIDLFYKKNPNNPTIQKDTFGEVVSGLLWHSGRSFDNMDAKGMNLTSIHWGRER